MTFISKSKYIAGLQCKKLLWYNYNAKDRIPPYDEGTLAVFDQGHQVGRLAQSLYPGGVEIGGDHTDFDDIVRRSTEALALRKPLFEPAFRSGSAFARADILLPVRPDRWDIIEVKSSTAVKDVYVDDLALQKYVYAGAGLDIRNCVILYVDNTYEREGDVVPEKLFAKEDVTVRVDALLSRVGPELERMLDVIRLPESPVVPIGPWCGDPYDCPLKPLCWDFLPERSVFDLTRIGDRGFELLKEGVASAADIPADFHLTRAQSIQLRAFKTGKAQVKKPLIEEFLKKLKYPLYFLDFETLATAIPLFDHVRPYQQIPFQFSLHVVRRPGQDPERHAFIAKGRNDPRPELLGTLIPLLGRAGTIVSYNAPFERRMLKESAEAYPAHKASCGLLDDRFVDLLSPFRSFNYYSPSQGSSASMKEVLPALTGKGYGQMEIADGGTASREYLRVTFGDVPDKENERVRSRLEEYCSLDTSGMIEIAAALESLVR